MKTIAVIAGSALFGLGLCAMEVMIFRSPWFSVTFPSPGGEDDFSLRATAFLFGVCPAFALTGGLIGLGSSRGRLNARNAWIGAAAGFVIVFFVTRFLRDFISHLSEAGNSNRAVLLFFISWVLLTALGAAFGGRARRRFGRA